MLGKGLGSLSSKPESPSARQRREQCRTRHCWWMSDCARMSTSRRLRSNTVNLRCLNFQLSPYRKWNTGLSWQHDSRGRPMSRARGVSSLHRTVFSHHCLSSHPTPLHVRVNGDDRQAFNCSSSLDTTSEAILIPPQRDSPIFSVDRQDFKVGPVSGFRLLSSASLLSYHTLDLFHIPQLRHQ